jgi:predicted ATP-grasp superfamily ATP-dependent carboligase
MPGLSDVKVSRGSLQRQIEKLKTREEKLMNRMKKPDKRKGQENKGER